MDDVHPNVIGRFSKAENHPTSSEDQRLSLGHFGTASEDFLRFPVTSEDWQSVGRLANIFRNVRRYWNTPHTGLANERYVDVLNSVFSNVLLKLNEVIT